MTLANNDIRRWQRHKLSRRQVLRGTALGGAGVATVATLGCGRGQQPTSTPTAKEPKRGGIINVALNSGHTRGRPVDPHTSTNRYADTYRLFYQGLMGLNARTGELEGELAQRLEQPSQIEYVFTLHPGVKFHNKPPANGRLMTAQDVAWSLERARTPEARFQGRTLFEFVDTIQAVDGATVKVTMKSPHAPMLSNFAASTVMVMAPEVVEKARRFNTPDEVVGTGPFILTSFEEQVVAEHVRNPDYWKPGLPYLDGVRTFYFESEGPQYAAFLGGKVHVALVPGEQVKDFLARQGPDTTPAWAPSPSGTKMQAQTRTRPMDDPRVTKALRLLVDHKEFNEHGVLLHGRARHAFQFPTTMEAWDLTHEEYEQYLEWKPDKTEAVREALRLLEAAGYSRSNPLQFEVSCFDSGNFLLDAQLLDAQWRRLSGGIVDAKLRPLDNATQEQVRVRRQFVYAYLGQSGFSDEEPDSWLSTIYRTGGSRNYEDFSNPHVDALIEQQRVEFNAQRRKALVREFLIYMIDVAPSTKGYNSWVLNAASPKVQNRAPEWWIKSRQYEQVWLEP